MRNKNTFCKPWASIMKTNVLQTGLPGRQTLASGNTLHGVRWQSPAVRASPWIEGQSAHRRESLGGLLRKLKDSLKSPDNSWHKPRRTFQPLPRALHGS